MMFERHSLKVDGYSAIAPKRVTKYSYKSKEKQVGMANITIGRPDMCVDFILVSESEITLNTRAWKLSRSRDARVGIVITMIHRIYILPR
jgi:hypothetical protein